VSCCQGVVDPGARRRGRRNKDGGLVPQLRQKRITDVFVAREVVSGRSHLTPAGRTKNISTEQFPRTRGPTVDVSQKFAEKHTYQKYVVLINDNNKICL